MSNPVEIYPLGRDKAESSRYVFLLARPAIAKIYRLNDQHKLIVDIVGGAIDETVSLDSVTSVADVATGTG